VHNRPEVHQLPFYSSMDSELIMVHDTGALAGDVVLCFGNKNEETLRARATHASQILSKYDGALLVFSGDGRKRSVSRITATEASRMREIAISLGIPDSRILLEENSNTTEENVGCFQKMLFQRMPAVKVTRIIAVSCPYHMDRVEILLQRAFPEVAVVRSPCEGIAVSPQELQNERRRVARLRRQ
jgi:uncharacterized SAM-binding protein YcdF (DUF218 family)